MSHATAGPEGYYINPRLVETEYAVRGLIPTRAQQIREEIEAGSTAYPFKEMVFCNVGNPHSLKQKPLTFFRQVMSLMDSPQLLEIPGVLDSYPPDAVARARAYLAEIGQATGSYSDSMGHAFARRAVVSYIKARDGDVKPEPSIDNIILTDGASMAVKAIMQMLLADASDAMMIPIPQYPLYSAQITLLGAKKAPYYLDEDNNWQISVQSLIKTYDECVAKERSTPRVMVCINPGNPTGCVLDVSVMEEVIKFCHARHVLLLADEVYQENIYPKNVTFHSFRKILLNMPPPYSTETMLISLHTTSKGVIGECGRRGGYLEMVNIPQKMISELVKMCSIHLCSNVNGQVMMALMCTPPRPGDASYELYHREYMTILDSMRERAAMMVREMNTIRGFSCKVVQGAMYVYPKLTLPKGYIEHNNTLNAEEGRKLEPDARWALELLESTGIVVVPGSGFGQEEGTLHFRTTILPPMEQLQRMVVAIRKFQESIYDKYA